MKKNLFVLILFVFFIFTPILFAREKSPLDFKDKDPTQQSDAKGDSRTNFDSWEAGRKIRDNFMPLRTVPLYNNEKVDVEIGPVQFQIRFAI